MTKTKLGIKKPLFGKYREVKGLVCIEKSQAGEEIIIYGDLDKNKKLGVINCGFDSEAEKRFKDLDGKIASFTSKPPTEHKQHGRRLVPYPFNFEDYCILGSSD